MLENREDPGRECAAPAGVEDREEAEEQEAEESGPAEALWQTGLFFRPWRITTNVSKPRAAFITSCGGEGKNHKNQSAEMGYFTHCVIHFSSSSEATVERNCEANLQESRTQLDSLTLFKHSVFPDQSSDATFVINVVSSITLPVCVHHMLFTKWDRQHCSVNLKCSKWLQGLREWRTDVYHCKQLLSHCSQRCKCRFNGQQNCIAPVLPSSCWQLSL